MKRFKINEEVQSLNLIMLACFCIYFIFISLYPIKTYGYSMPFFLPVIVYFVIYGIDSILTTISFGFNKEENFNKKLSIRIHFHSLFFMMFHGHMI